MLKQKLLLIKYHCSDKLHRLIIALHKLFLLKELKGMKYWKSEINQTNFILHKILADGKQKQEHKTRKFKLIGKQIRQRARKLSKDKRIVSYM